MVAAVLASWPRFCAAAKSRALAAAPEKLLQHSEHRRPARRSRSPRGTDERSQMPPSRSNRQPWRCKVTDRFMPLQTRDAPTWTESGTSSIRSASAIASGLGVGKGAFLQKTLSQILHRAGDHRSEERRVGKEC